MATEDDLAILVSQKTKNNDDDNFLTVSEAKKVINAITVAIEEFLVKNEKVKIENFGTFQTRIIPEYLKTNPKTEEITKVEATTVPAFFSDRKKIKKKRKGKFSKIRN